jgi:hypothetical protein
VTADHQKVVHPQEDLKVDLQEAVILTDPAMTQEPHVDLEHREQNQAIVFQESANHTIQMVASVSLTKEEIVNHSIAIIVKVVSAVHSEIASHLMASASRTKEEIVNHSIAITVKAESVVHSGIVSHLMGKESHTKVEENANRSIAITAKVASANHTKAANASLLVELKTQHVHLTKEIIAGIAMRPLK